MARRRRHKRGGGRWLGYLLSFLVGALLTAGLTFWLLQENPPSPEPFSQSVRLANQVIQSQLYEMGIAKRDILVQKSSPKGQGELSWEHSYLKVLTPRSLSHPLIEDHLRRALSNLERPVSIEASQARDAFQLEVKVQDRITHQLVFVSPQIRGSGPSSRAKVAIVIDDLGGENHLSHELLDVNLPITFSILPFSPYSKRLAMEAHTRGKEVILHLPMEPHGYPGANPGEGALLHEMDQKSLLGQLSKDLEAIPHVLGASNHMGSRFMEDPEKLRVLFKELKRRGLYFLDSLTTPKSTGLRTAREVGLRARERSVFLDHSLAEGDIRERLDTLAQVALSTGKAIGVGHPHASTVKLLREAAPRWKEKGIAFVSLSEVME